jgi:hypothetical protein
VKDLARRIASAMLASAARLLPRNLSPWAAAMERELAEIPEGRAALAFAAGCLRVVLGLAISARLGSLQAAARRILFPPPPSHRSKPAMDPHPARPRWLGLICGAAAVGVGLAYMRAAGAPPRYLLVNLASLVLGATAWLALGRIARAPVPGTGPLILALAVLVLATALFGAQVDGAARWVSVGSLSLQVSFIVVPLMVVLYARRPDPIGTAGILAAALALALQPDPAMAGVLLAGLLALLLASPGRLALVATAGSMLAFGFTLLRSDALPAVPYVDRILYTAFDIHPLAGAAVLVGAAALVLPALAGAWSGTSERPALFAFGGCWLAVIAAAAIGNYPTPLVGYGGSAVLGYLLSVALLPNGARRVGRGIVPTSRPAARRSLDRTTSELRVPHLAWSERRA